ncbi:cell division protein FtsK [Corallococcus sp. CA053C]|uniref:MXAN_5187 family protein n=1 Tax=Corallococcus sp. CA053C TaxID=2316732 RepID=UPI000EA0BAA6|nr:MXAN_5187 family protein [Corallococcus sp. CA053C]RKH05983.1 cell division protein FtsK [Corallococcus sp. CA053C]
MVRLKFLLFALLVLGLGLAHLPTLSAPQRARAVEGAALQAATGTGEVARRVDARRAEIQSLALKLASAPDVAAAVHALRPAPAAPKSPRDRSGRDAEESSAPLPLTAERFGVLRTAVQAALPKDLQGTVVAVVAGDASFHARADAEPSSDAAVLDVPALAKAGTSVVDAFGAPHVFAAVPLAWNDERIPAPAVTLVVGAPLVADAALQGALDASGVAALGLVQGDKVVGGVGAEKAKLEGALPKVAAGAKDTVLETGSLQALGPVQLPVFTSGDAMGGQAPLFVGARQPLQGTPYEVLVIAGTAATLAPLAAYQHSALLGLAGLLLLSLLWTALMGGGRRSTSDEEATAGNGGDTLGWSAALAAQPTPAAVAPPPAAAAPLADPFGSASSSEPRSNPFGSALSPEPVSNAFSAVAPPPVRPASDPFGGADAFPFPPAGSSPSGPLTDPFAMPPPSASADPFAMPPPSAAPIPLSNPYSAPAPDPFAGVESFPFPSPPSAYPPPAAEPFTPPPAYAHNAPMPFDHAPPSNEPIAQAAPRHGAFAFEDQPTAAYSLQQAANPFALAAAQSSEQDADSNPETTRVAAIPRELLQASTRPTSEAIPMPPPRSHASQAIPLPGGNSAAAVALSEEQHFQDVFREFVTTRERCGEAADGLTYDKFVQKLRKNKEQLVTKYACKTVRFQVYVKEGKAALKATPVKD